MDWTEVWRKGVSSDFKVFSLRIRRMAFHLLRQDFVLDLRLRYLLDVQVVNGKRIVRYKSLEIQGWSYETEWMKYHHGWQLRVGASEERSHGALR